MAEPRRNISELGKVCSRNIEIFDMLDCKSMVTPMDTNLKLLFDETLELVDMTQYKQIIGSLIYLMNTRTYICFVVNTLSRYLVKTRQVHLIVAKHVMRYLKGTIDLGLHYGRDHDYKSYKYTNSCCEGSVEDKKVT